MSNAAWLCDLLKMRNNGLPNPVILARLREARKNGEYEGLNIKWAKDNIKFYRMGGE